MPRGVVLVAPELEVLGVYGGIQLAMSAMRVLRRRRVSAAGEHYGGKYRFPARHPSVPLMFSLRLPSSLYRQTQRIAAKVGVNGSVLLTMGQYERQVQ